MLINIALAKESLGRDDPVKLDTLPALKYLHIGAQTGFWRNEDPNIYDPINWVCSLLSSIPPSNNNNIKTFTFSSSYGMMPIPSTLSAFFSIIASSPSSLPPSPLPTNYFGPSFQMYPMLDVLLSHTTKFPNLQRVNFHIEEAPFYKDYMEVPPHTFSVQAKWVEDKIRNAMRALIHADRIRISSSEC